MNTAIALALAYFVALPASVLVGMALEKRTPEESPIPGLVLLLLFGAITLTLGAYLL